MTYCTHCTIVIAHRRPFVIMSYTCTCKHRTSSCTLLETRICNIRASKNALNVSSNIYSSLVQYSRLEYCIWTIFEPLSALNSPPGSGVTPVVASGSRHRPGPTSPPGGQGRTSGTWTYSVDRFFFARVHVPSNSMGLAGPCSHLLTESMELAPTFIYMVHPFHERPLLVCALPSRCHGGRPDQLHRHLSGGDWQREEVNSFGRYHYTGPPAGVGQTGPKKACWTKERMTNNYTFLRAP